MKTKLLTLLITVLIVNFFACDNNTERRKIKLSDESVSTSSNKQLTTTIHLEPAERRSVAVMFFENLTGDDNLQWLQKGLTEMLIRALSQSHSLSVLSTERLFEILDRLGRASSANNIDVDLAAIVAREANVETVLTGNITKVGDSLKINVRVHEANQGKILREESVEGPGLETIFSMVDNLTNKIKNNLQLASEKAERDKGIVELSTNSLDAWRFYIAGVDFSNKLMHADAIPKLDKAIELDSTFVAAYLKLYYEYLSQKEVKQAYNIFDKIQSLKSKASQKELYQIALIEAHSNNDIKTVINVNEEWIEQYPDDRDAYYSMATLYFNVHNFAKAIPHFKKTLAIDPKYKLALNQLGYSYVYVGDFPNAISTLKKYQKIAPDEPNPFDSLGEIYLFLGEFKDAEKQFEQALKINENFFHALKHLGHVNLDMGKYSEALKIFKMYRDKESTSILKSAASYNIALTNWRLGQRDKALNNFQQTVKHSKFSLPVVTYIYDIYLEKKDSTNAQKTLKQNYDRIKKSLKSGNRKIDSAAQLCLLSLWYNFNINESIDILTEIIIDSDNASQTQIKFLLALLYIKSDQFEKIQKLWENFSPSEILAILKEVHHLSYSNMWKYYSIINQAYNQSTTQGTNYYEEMINLSIENKAKTPEMIFRLFLADLYFKIGDVESAGQQLKIVGTPEEKTWLVIGPFDNKNGFQKKFPPEKKIRLNKVYEENGQSLTWQHPIDQMRDGFIDLKYIYQKSNWSVAYGLLYILSSDNRKVQFRIGSNEAIKVWLNDEEIWKFNDTRNAIFDDNVVNVSLKKGSNKVLVKVCNRLGDWGFYFRVTDENGNGVSDIQFISPDEQA